MYLVKILSRRNCYMTNKEIIDRMKKGNLISVGIDKRMMMVGRIKDLIYIKSLEEEGYYFIKIDSGDAVFQFDSREIEINIWSEFVDDEEIYHSEIGNLKKAELTKLLPDFGMDKDCSFSTFFSKLVDEWEEYDDEKKEMAIEILGKYEFEKIIPEISGAYKTKKVENKELHDWKINKLDDEINFYEKFIDWQKKLPKEIGEVFIDIVFKSCELKLG